MNTLLEKNFVAEGAIPANRIVKHGSGDFSMVVATAATDALIGVSARDFDAVAGERIDIMTHGIAPVRLGGTVTRGAAITSDASGQGITAAPAAGSNVRVIGAAMQSGVSGDVIDVLLSQSVMQG